MRGITFVLFSLSFTLSAQTEDQISSLVLPALVAGKISSSEAEEIRQYLNRFGLPNVLEEAWSIPGLSASASIWLVESDTWQAWTLIDKTVSRGRIMLQSNYTFLGGQETQKDLRMSGKGCGFRVIDREGEIFISGYAKGGNDCVSYALGDYYLHWGAGLTADRYDPYSSLRSTHTLGARSRPFEAAMPSSFVDYQRGGVVSIKKGPIWTSTAVNFESVDENLVPEVKSCLFYNYSLTGGEVEMGLIQNHNRGYGCFLRAEVNNIVCEAEVLKAKSGIEYLYRAVISSGRGSYAYFGLGSNEKTVLGYRLGTSSRTLDLEACSQDGEANLDLKANYFWQFTPVSHLQARMRVVKTVSSRAQIGLRLRSEIGVKPAAFMTTIEFQKLLGESNMSRGIRVDVKGKRRFSVAFIHGSSESRLYQLLPSAIGYRLFSVVEGEYKFVICWELFPGKMKVSWEKAIAEGSETNRFAISLTHGKYIRH